MTQQHSERLADMVIADVLHGRGSSKRPKHRLSATVDADLWDEVVRLVDDAAAEHGSAATEEALALWVANQRLRRGLDEIYDRDPEARPTEEQIERAGRMLGLR